MRAVPIQQDNAHRRPSSRCPEPDICMKLPTEATIAPEKLTHYLLVKQPRADKSLFLQRAGYTLANCDQLLKDLRAQILPQEAAALENTKFGQLYEIIAPLTGPNSRTVRVKTIWMTEHLSKTTKFITLIPQ